MVCLAATRDVPELALVADAAALPFRDGTFDLVVAYMSLHDIDQMPQAVAQRIDRRKALLASTSNCRDVRQSG